MAPGHQGPGRQGPGRQGRRTATCRVRPALAVPIALVALLGAGCAGGDGNVGRAEKYRKVIEDPSPRARDVVRAAGAPAAVARAGDGSVLLTYAAQNVEDDEGPAAFAWRLFSPDGKKVAERAEHTRADAATRRFVGTADGFVAAPRGESAEGAYFLDARGTRHSVRTGDKPLGARRGDVLVSALEPTLVYRPSSRTLAPVAGLSDEALELAVDSRGVVWAAEQRLTASRDSVVSVRDGHTRRHTLPERTSVPVVAADGGTAVFALARHGRGAGEAGRVDGLLISGDDGKSWRTLGSSRDLPLDRLKKDPAMASLGVLADGRVLAGQDGGPYWLADEGRNRSFHEVDGPVAFTSLTARARTLYGIADSATPSYGRVKGEGLWISRDGGRTWSRFPGDSGTD
ncbi:hypothetical protein OG533_28905 [Streptomyces sp. NBC_01186]|uniref:hypothetical protein n=1 Tax=Streptomyces sp. NBC_01186 TaxID=2903765 RepID=UPI002E0E72AC|nr:hypothetical protein OG533_28905 [Streptomyces sp. NBC_01186]